LWDYIFRPRIPDDMHIDPYTGYITWETGVSPYHLDQASYPVKELLRPTGLESDASQRSTYTLLQPRSMAAPQNEMGPAVMDDIRDYQAILDVTYRAGGGYDLDSARCVAREGYAVYNETCRSSARTLSYSDLDDSEKAAIYQGSRSYSDLYCDTQQGYAGAWNSTRHYRTAQGCIRRSSNKPPKRPGVYPIVVIAYSKSYDGYKNSNGTFGADVLEKTGMSVYASGLNARKISKIQDQAYVKASINVNVYLYPALHYCAKGCKNSESLRKDIAALTNGSPGALYIIRFMQRLKGKLVLCVFASVTFLQVLTSLVFLGKQGFRLRKIVAIMRIRDLERGVVMTTW
jgi:hypothetical protein